MMQTDRQLCLFELVVEDGTAISPYAWRTRFLLMRLGLQFKTEGVGFTGIREIADGQFTTVPVLCDGENYIADSWHIADYLDARTGGCVFEGAGERAMVRFFDIWARAALLLPLTRICARDIWRRLKPEDRDYFRVSREARLGMTLEAAEAERSETIAGFSQGLDPLRQALKECPFIGGAAPNYADFIALSAFVWAGSVTTVQLLDLQDPLCAWIIRGFALFGEATAQAQRGIGLPSV
jgi:glutathione S-transferase